jgi:hypothetical protein
MTKALVGLVGKNCDTVAKKRHTCGTMLRAGLNSRQLRVAQVP